MTTLCDNKSVGLIIPHNGQWAIIQRKNFPRSFALVAGHLDGDTYEDAARKEAREEANIDAIELVGIFEGKFKNLCKRIGGTWHHWKVYEATTWRGNARAGSDAAELHWVGLDGMVALMQRTLHIANQLGVKIQNLAESTLPIVTHPTWARDPGLEPVWYVIMESLITRAVVSTQSLRSLRPNPRI